MNWYCYLESDRYGREVYEYDNAREADEGYKRLVESAGEHTCQDGEPRTVSLVKKRFSTEENE